MVVGLAWIMFARGKNSGHRVCWTSVFFYHSLKCRPKHHLNTHKLFRQSQCQFVMHYWWFFRKCVTWIAKVTEKTESREWEKLSEIYKLDVVLVICVIGGIVCLILFVWSILAPEPNQSVFTQCRGDTKLLSYSDDSASSRCVNGNWFVNLISLNAIRVDIEVNLILPIIDW